MWFLNLFKRVWDEIDDLVINSISGFIVKMVIFYLSLLAVWIMGKNSDIIMHINSGETAFSTIIFYLFLIVGIGKYLNKHGVKVYYDFIDSKNFHSARVKKRKNQLLEDSMDQLPGKSGKILESKADEINEFTPSEED